MLSSIFQGILQGLTEYLPVSSSGHLALFQHFTHFQGANIAFDLALHVATLLATVAYFWRDIVELAISFFGGFARASYRREEGWRFGWSVVLGTVVTGVIGILLKDFVEKAALSVPFVGICLLFSGLLCLLACLLKGTGGHIGLKIGLLVGLAQGFAVLPGVSRSGMTIVTALALGLVKEQAFRFSFILSLPAIAGAAILELFSKDFSFALLPSGWWLGCLLAFVVGLGALHLLRRMVARGSWAPFGVYCLLLGAVALIFG